MQQTAFRLQVGNRLSVYNFFAFSIKISTILLLILNFNLIIPLNTYNSFGLVFYLHFINKNKIMQITG